MKWAVDSFMIRHLPLRDVVRAVADVGYRYLELGARDDFLPSYLHPRADREAVAELKSALAETGLQLAALVLGDYRWAMPDEESRTAAVRYWKRSVEIAAELECKVIQSEFGGVPEHPEQCEAAFWRSLEEILPLHERHGVSLTLQAHPYNFIEENNAAVDLIRAVDHELVGYCFVTAHIFHLHGDIGDMIHYAARNLQHVLLGDTHDHTASSGNRFIINPFGAPVTVHEHLRMGEGDVDFAAVFEALADVGFDGILTNNVFSQEELALDVYRDDRETTLRYLKEAGLGVG